MQWRMSLSVSSVPFVHIATDFIRVKGCSIEIGPRIWCWNKFWNWIKIISKSKICAAAAAKQFIEHWLRQKCYEPISQRSATCHSICLIEFGRTEPFLWFICSTRCKFCATRENHDTDLGYLKTFHLLTFQFHAEFAMLKRRTDHHLQLPFTE